MACASVSYRHSIENTKSIRGDSNSNNLTDSGEHIHDIEFERERM